MLIETALGTAFAISATMAATAEHATFDDIHIKNTHQDIALIPGEYETYFQTDCRELEKGELLFNAGLPIAFGETVENYIQRPLTISYGYYIGTDRIKGRTAQIHSGQSQSGMSGGIVLDTDIEAVGVVTSTVRDNGNRYTGFTSICEVEKLMQNNVNVI